MLFQILLFQSFEITDFISLEYGGLVDCRNFLRNFFSFFSWKIFNIKNIPPKNNKNQSNIKLGFLLINSYNFIAFSSAFIG